MIKIGLPKTRKIMFREKFPYLYFKYKHRRYYIDDIRDTQWTLKKKGWTHYSLGKTLYTGIVIKFSGYREVTVAEYSIVDSENV